MKLCRNYEVADYKKAIMVGVLHHEDRQRDIEHLKKFDDAQSKRNKGMTTEISTG
jgi:hypothetical protein